MTQIEQLTAIISQARRELKGAYVSSGDIDRAIAERLVEKGAVLLPCKVGDTVYWVDDDILIECRAETMQLDEFVNDDNTVQLGVQIDLSVAQDGFYKACTEDDFGKIVFLTEEEALCKIQSKRAL